MWSEVELALDAFAPEIELPRGPVQSITSVKYIDPDNVEQLYSTVLTAYDGYQLARLWVDPDVAGYDMGRILVAGTISGTVSTKKDIDVIYMGYIWCNVNVARNLNAVLTLYGGGAMVIEDGDGHLVFFATPDTGSLIHVGGTLNYVDSRYGMEFYTAVEVENDPEVEDPTNIIRELEKYMDVPDNGIIPIDITPNGYIWAFNDMGMVNAALTRKPLNSGYVGPWTVPTTSMKKAL